MKKEHIIVYLKKWGGAPCPSAPPPRSAAPVEETCFQARNAREALCIVCISVGTQCRQCNQEHLKRIFRYLKQNRQNSLLTSRGKPFAQNVKLCLYSFQVAKDPMFLYDL